ncbi:AAA family ATPase [Kitasatospora sp. P5_F3]
MMLRQTLEARNPRTALLTSGAIFDAGTYRDLITDHNSEKKLTFSIGLDSESFFGQRRQRVAVPRALEVSFSEGGGGEIALSKYRVVDSGNASLIMRSLRADGTYNVASPILPTSESIGRPLREVSGLRKALREERPEGFLFSGYGALGMPSSWREDEDRWKKSRHWYVAANDLVDLHMDVNNEIENRLKSISYLGPLRSLPKRTYRVSAEPPTDVGRDGEFAPELLFRRADDEVHESVNRWLQALGYGKLVFSAPAEDFFQVHLRPEGRSTTEVNLAHCGIGLSQLLPMLVQGAITPVGGTLISQQPEIHLNPAQQCQVSDFLIETAVHGKRVIVETHSEHVLLRIRRRIAEGRIDSGDVAVYFLDKEEGRTVIERIPMGGMAEVEPSAWPVGFFEEQLEDSFALAVAQSRKKRA